MAGSLQATFHALRIRGKEGGEGHGPVVQLQVGGGIVQHLGLVDVYIQSPVGLHLKCRLDTHFGCHGLGGVVRARKGVFGAYPAKFALRVIVLLGVVVSGQPPGGVVPRHGKFRELIGHLEIREGVLHGEFVAEAQTVVVQAETDVHVHAVFPAQLHQQLVVVVADLRLFAPYGLPGLVKGRCLRPFQLESLLQVPSVHEPVTQAGRFYNRFPVKVQCIYGDAVFREAERGFQPPVRALELVVQVGNGCFHSATASHKEKAENDNA